MTRRSTIQQTKHDKKVRSIADNYRNNGYEVKADIPGFKTPEGIGKNKRVPDIVAEKNGKTKIIEVETIKSLKTDKEQQSTFIRSASHRKNTTFHIEITK